MIKKYKGAIITYVVLAFCSLAAATFFDLKLDIFLNNPENAFAIWFKNTGEIPGYLICPLGGAVLYYFGKNKLLKIAGFASCIIGSAVLGGYLGDYFFIDDTNKMPFAIIFGIGVGAFIMFFAQFIHFDEKTEKALVILAIVGFVALALQCGFINIVKVLWGRVRFRDLIAAGSYNQFTSWFIPNGVNGNKSFPSGHTAGAGMSYLLMLMPYASEKCKKHQLCFALPLVYTGIVAFTRLVMGAHYLSDVTVGGTVSFVIAICAIAIIEKKKLIKD